MLAKLVDKIRPQAFMAVLVLGVVAGICHVYESK